MATNERVFIITGANTGVGLASARAIACGVESNSSSSSASGSNEPARRRVILACRNMDKARAAVASIQASMESSAARGRNVVECMQLDLTDIRSIKSFARAFQQRQLPLHVLLNNAGVNKAPALAQPLKCEGQFVANFLGHFHLTNLLLPTLQASAPSRVINVTSYMHRLGSTDFETQCRAPTAKSYSTSKLAQIFQAYALQREWAPRGVRFFLVHPGACYSDIWNTWEPAFLRKLNPLLRKLFLSTEQGAASSVHAATKPLAEGQGLEVEHWGPYATPFPGWEIATDAWQPSGWSKVTQSRTAAVTYDEAIGQRLMRLSERLVQEWQQAAKQQEGQE